MEVHSPCTSRTNIEIDDDLIAECMRRFNLPSKRSATELALRRLVATEPGTIATAATGLSKTRWSD